LGVSLFAIAQVPKRAGLNPLPRDGRTEAVSIVLPARDEEAIIGRTVSGCTRVLGTLGSDYEIIVVDDGSRDRTGQILDRISAQDSRVRVIHNDHSLGYGGALRAGFDAATKELLFFMDSDGQFDISDIAALFALRAEGCQAALGYRARRRDSAIRRANASAWNRLVSGVFGLHVRDVDCAFKLFETRLIRELDLACNGAMVNTEILVKLASLGVKFGQVPVRHYERETGRATGANIRVIVRAFADLLVNRKKLKAWASSPSGHFEIRGQEGVSGRLDGWTGNPADDAVLAGSGAREPAKTG
jgi:glycosyltransferase involved in cell wall biosynthesis